MIIYSTRHGQTSWNLDNRILGVTDLDLTYNGLEQAKTLAEEIEKLGGVDVIFVSPMKRARQTASVVADRLGVPTVIEERLTEWDYGDYEGKPRNYEGFQPAKLQFGCRMGGTGESLLQLAHRVYDFLDEIRCTCSDDKILLVSHGGVCRVIETYFHNMTNDEFRNFFMGNCQILRYETTSAADTQRN